MMAIRQMCVCVSVCVSRRSWNIVDKQVVTHSGLNYTTFCYAFLVCSTKVCYRKIEQPQLLGFKTREVLKLIELIKYFKDNT